MSTRGTFQAQFSAARLSSRRYGFTLLELLIAMSLSAILMVVLVGGISVISNNWEYQDEQLDQAIDDSLIRLEIEKAIMGAFPYTFREKNRRHIYFKGDPQQLSFVSTFSPSYDNQLTIWVLKARAQGGLSIMVAPALTGDPQQVVGRLGDKLEQQATEVLLKYQVGMEYLRQQNHQKYWVKNWDAETEKALPAAVRLTLMAKDENDVTGNESLVALILANEHQSMRKTPSRRPASPRPTTGKRHVSLF